MGLLFFACQKENIPTYDDLTSDRYVYTARFWYDSTEISFFFYPGETEILFPISVRSTGAGLIDEYFKLNVVDSLTTAPASLYEIPDKSVMRAGYAFDTCWVKLKYDPILDIDKVRLVLKLTETDDFKVGRTECQEVIIWFHNLIAKPSWWTSSVTSYYLGNYSDKKYTTYLDAIGVDLSGKNDSELRHYALLFKKWLKEQKAAGNTVYEEDGNEMIVPVLGNLVD